MKKAALRSLNILKLLICTVRRFLIWLKRPLIAWAKFVRNKKSVILSTFMGMLLGLAVSMFFQYQKYEMVESIPHTPSRIDEKLFSDMPTNAIIFNANDISESEVEVGRYIGDKLPVFTFDAQFDWWLRRTYENTIIVYITDKYRNQAIRIGKILNRAPIVVAYSETPFRGLEERDVAIFVGKDFKKLRLQFKMD